MSFIRYLKESVSFIIFYIFLMTFILLLIFMDRQNRMLGSNIIYLASVSFLIFVVFIIYDYYLKSSYIKKLKIVKDSVDKTPILPRAETSKDKLYSEIISDLYEDYTEKLKNIEEEFKDSKEFMVAWVHEIKTPITTLKLLLDSGEENLESYGEEVDKINDYVEKVLYNSRSDNFSKDYIISETSLNRLIKGCIKKHSLAFIKSKIRVLNEVQDEISVDTDGKWLGFILNQILSNSLKYTESGGWVRFSIKEDDDEKILCVEDNGIGIKKEDINNLFSKAFTGHNGRKEKSKATGFGLYLSQKLAKKLGHYITISSEYGKGTKVYIHFPKWCDYYDVTKV